MLPREGEDVASAASGDIPVVVLVDDDRASLDLMSAYLDGWPIQILRATDGVTALDLIAQVLPAAVVLDIKLPRLDGWHVLSQLKAAPETAAIPVVVARSSTIGPGAWPRAQMSTCVSRWTARTYRSTASRGDAAGIGSTSLLGNAVTACKLTRATCKLTRAK